MNDDECWRGMQMLAMVMLFAVGMVFVVGAAIAVHYWLVTP